MHIAKLLDPERIACQQEGSSKKRALETLSKLLASGLPDFTDGEIFDSLIGRERLGSTGLGKGVALPHGRMSGLDTPIAALLTLEKGIDYDAIDNQPVDLLFALLVPEESTDEHLKILALLAEMFSNADFCSQLRKSSNAKDCLDLINHWNTNQQLSA
ncbi:phosphotransferase IIA-like nitrogen-regulatory protein PtsN [Thiogranum longum]|uniref:Phosphotransferase IIA-like nitrogen-regulatory protein PtsN n=1 Tax=Thiogranum longum TaxID=1537524 RepID=A0A4R1HBG4_9GAMM|nr:PTS IIA-like nitrogen regulatory protein PtsN [Thiogranum longum]TCK17555.1 phosphotransferase IIA-like nitrogen-regulatory protein PtsN [Thiogranum longum]